MNYSNSKTTIPGIAHVDTLEDLTSVIEDAIAKDTGEYLNQAQVKALLSRSRSRALA